MYLRIVYKIHVFGFMSQHPCISRIRCKIHVSGYMSQHPFISQDPLQDPCLRIHVSDSCLSIHQYGSSARSMSPDSCLSIFVSQDSLQDPCLRIHVSASTNMDPLQDPRLRIHVSASLYLRLLCKIHVSGSVYKHPYVSQDPLQDPCLRIHVSASLYLRNLCQIHVSGSMSQHLYISGASARSMSPIHVLASLSSDFVALRRRNANFDLRRRVVCGPAHGKQSGRDPRERFAQAKRKF